MTSKSIENLYLAIEEQLQSLGFSYGKPGALSKCVLEASDYFVQEKGETPWGSKGFQAAYIAHFLPMNIFRWIKAFDRMERADVSGLQSFVDFGAGPLTFRLAHFLKYEQDNLPYFYIEKEKRSALLGEKIYKSLVQKTLAGRTVGAANANKSQASKVQIQELDLSLLNKKEFVQDKTLVLSYSLNELKTIPSYFEDFKNFLILEPSTQNISRSLLEFRAQSIAKGYSAMAPCLHSEACPMLSSKKDWCFDRVHIELSSNVQGLYKNLPFNTRYLTFSYLWLSKDRMSYRDKTCSETKQSYDSKSNDEVQNDSKKSFNPFAFRAVGDWQKEKGKSKIMVCRSSEREFLSLMKKQLKSDLDLNDIQRGDFSDAHYDFDKKGNELRVPSAE